MGRYHYPLPETAAVLKNGYLELLGGNALARDHNRRASFGCPRQSISINSQQTQNGQAQADKAVTLSSLSEPPGDLVSS